MENVRKLDGGILQARCPACAEAGQDRKGEHLRILPDGRFGCCVHPKDGDHRKKIFALAGDKSLQDFSIRVAGAKPTIPELCSVKAILTTVNLGTPGTGKSKSGNCAPNIPEPEIISLGTLGTLWFNPYAYRKDSLHICKDSGSGVPGVPSGPDPEVLLLPTAAPCGEPPLRLPFLTLGGDLSIPFDSPERYHWWKGGQSVASTRAEVLARTEAEGVCRDG